MGSLPGTKAQGEHAGKHALSLRDSEVAQPAACKVVQEPAGARSQIVVNPAGVVLGKWGRCHSHVVALSRPYNSKGVALAQIVEERGADSHRTGSSRSHRLFGALG